MNKYTFPIITVLILLIAVLGFGGYFYFQNKTQPQQDSQPSPVVTSDPVSEPTIEETITEPPNPIDQSIRNPLSDIQNPLNDLPDDLLEDIPNSSLDDVDYNPFS